jgi:hypothetical protein
MKWMRMCVCVAVALAVAFPFVCERASAEQPDWPQRLKDTKKPNDWVEWGYDLRIRNERFPEAILRNLPVPDPINEWWRFRQRLYLNVTPTEDLLLRLRIVNESRPIESPDHYRSSNPYDNYDHWD